MRCLTCLYLNLFKSYDTKHKKHKNSKNTNLTKLVNSCKNIFKYFQALLWILQWKIEIQRPNISHFKAFDIRNSEYGTRNPQKIYNRAAITESIHYEIHLNRLFISSQDSLCPSSIHSWSIGHILEHDFFCLGHLGCAGSKEKKWIWGILSNFWGWFFQLFEGKKIFWKNFKNILATALKSYIKWLL